MKKIKEYVDLIEDELCSAKDYAEKSLWYKSQNNSIRYNKYREMATQELTHADTLHSFAVEDIGILENAFPDVPTEMMEAWETSHKKFIEKTAWVKQMLSL